MSIITADGRMRPLVWLLTTASAQLIAIWYPCFVANRNPSSDHDGRYFVLPELVIFVGALAVTCMLALCWRFKGHSNLSNAGTAVLALLAVAIASWPAIAVLYHAITSK